MNISGTEIEIVTKPYSHLAAPIDGDYDDQISSLLVKGEWNNGILDFVKKEELKGLYLNSAKGFKCQNFDFLLGLPELELLNIICSPVDTLSAIEKLGSLKSLSISCHWKKKLDLSGLKKLERSFISYGNGAESIFECSSLRYLYMDDFKIKSFAQLEQLYKIEYLTIGNSSFNSPDIVGKLKSLRKLVLLNCRKLDNLNGIDKLTNLEWLTIDGSKKLNSIKDLSSLKNLKVLQLSNNKEISTLSPINELTQLKALSFFGDTLFSDGDFTFLESLSSLSLVGFVGRRHYTHKPVRSWNWNDYESRGAGIVRK